MEAAKWIGTPFFANSNTPGPKGGVSCQKLAREIYRGCGFCDVPVPEVPMAYARFSRQSLLEPFVDARTEFERVSLREPFFCGDLLGFRIGKIVHHCGIYLGKGAFIHAMEHVGTITSAMSDATWGGRLAAAWRPIQQ